MRGEEHLKKKKKAWSWSQLFLFPRSFLVKVLCLVWLVYLSYFIKRISSSAIEAFFITPSSLQRQNNVDVTDFP